MSDLPYEIVLAGTELILEERGDWARIVTPRPGDRFAGILVI